MKQQQGRARALGRDATPQDTVRPNSWARLATARSDSMRKAPARVGIRWVAGGLDIAPEPGDFRAHSVSQGSLEERSEVVVMGSTLLCSADLRHVVPNGKEPAPMEAKATARMTQREQGHSAFFVVNGACKLPGTSHHKLPAPRRHHRVGKRLHQTNLRRDFHFLQDSAIAIRAKQVSLHIHSRGRGQQTRADQCPDRRAGRHTSREGTGFKVRQFLLRSKAPTLSD